MAELTVTKGHGTQNDFVLVPDFDGRLDLDGALVAGLCDRRAGLGGDGVIRVVRTEHASEPAVRALASHAAWFMDYRNADGSLAEMCGNGSRVFAAYLRREGLERGDQFTIATRAGLRPVRVEAAPPGSSEPTYAVGLGPARLTHEEAAARDGADALVHVTSGEPWSAISVDVGNPHTVVALPEEVDLARLDLTRAPLVHPTPPAGSNVEFVRVLGPGHIALRVHERGVGETRSCGTGAVAAAAATAFWAGADGGSRWLVDVPGGRLEVRLAADGTTELAGPAALIADAVVDLDALRGGLSPRD